LDPYYTFFRFRLSLGLQEFFTLFMIHFTFCLRNFYDYKFELNGKTGVKNRLIRF